MEGPEKAWLVSTGKDTKLHHEEGMNQTEESRMGEGRGAERGKGSRS